MCQCMWQQDDQNLTSKCHHVLAYTFYWHVKHVHTTANCKLKEFVFYREPVDLWVAFALHCHRQSTVEWSRCWQGWNRAIIKHCLPHWKVHWNGTVTCTHVLGHELISISIDTSAHEHCNISKHIPLGYIPGSMKVAKAKLATTNMVIIPE